MLQSQTAANPRQREEKKKKQKHTSANKQIYEKHKDQFPLTHWNIQCRATDN